MFPPPTGYLLQCFDEKFNKSGLTHGGRALSKHSVRDSSLFWGKCEGKVDYINEHAKYMINLLIRTSVWHNVFILPQNLRAFEIRNISGYGARWEYQENGIITFRGFVEPPMEDGHLKKWRH